eukprot:Em0019g154a
MITGALSALSAGVIWSAYEKKQQFYPTVVYLMNSNRAMGVLYLQAFLMVWMFAQLLKNIFFGTLRAVEIEQLIEKSWFAVLETFILLAGFHQDLSVGFVAVVTVLFVVKSFHSLASDRVDFMERSPLITALFHARIVSVLLILGALDLLFVHRAWVSLTTRGPSVDIVFGLEFAIMFTVAANVFLKYILHTIDLQSEDPWENKTIYIRYVDIVLGFFQLVLYVGYMLFMLYIMFMPLHIARRVYMAAKGVQNNIRDVVSSYHAIRNLNTLYPDATPEELNTTNNVCIICREEMTQRCKKLLCGHIFHTACLRSWFQRQQTCPTCRLDVLHPAAANGTRQHQRQRGAADQGRPGNQGRAGVPDVPLVFPGMWPGMVPGVVPPPRPQHRPPPQPQPAQQEAVPAAAAQAAAGVVDGPAARNGGGEAREQQDGQPGPQNLPPFPPGMSPFPFMIPPPPPPPFFMAPFGGMTSEAAMRQLSDEELRQLEGMERANVEARIAILRNVQALLDAAVSQLNQYSAVMTTLNPSGPGFPGYPPPPAEAPSSPPRRSTTGNEAAASSAQQSTPKGLFQTQRSTSPGVISEPARPLQERQNSFAFSAAAISPPREQGESEGEVVRNKSTAMSATPSDIAAEEIRRKRLERLNSLPNTPSNNTSSEGDVSKDSAKPSAQQPKGGE